MLMKAAQPYGQLLLPLLPPLPLLPLFLLLIFFLLCFPDDLLEERLMEGSWRGHGGDSGEGRGAGKSCISRKVYGQLIVLSPLQTSHFILKIKY